MKTYKRFSIDYYEGEEREPKLKPEHDSVKEAAEWCQANGVPLSVVRVTECDPENCDHYGPEYIGTCQLEEAFEREYETLDF